MSGYRMLRLPKPIQASVVIFDATLFKLLRTYFGIVSTAVKVLLIPTGPGPSSKNAGT